MDDIYIGTLLFALFSTIVVVISISTGKTLDILTWKWPWSRRWLVIRSEQSTLFWLSVGYWCFFMVAGPAILIANSAKLFPPGLF